MKQYVTRVSSFKEQTLTHTDPVSQNKVCGSTEMYLITSGDTFWNYRTHCLWLGQVLFRAKSHNPNVNKKVFRLPFCFQKIQKKFLSLSVDKSFSSLTHSRQCLSYCFSDAVKMFVHSNVLQMMSHEIMFVSLERKQAASSNVKILVLHIS